MNGKMKTIYPSAYFECRRYKYEQGLKNILINQRTKAHLTAGSGQGEIFDTFSQFQTCISPRAWATGQTTTWYKFWQHFKAFIIPIILYQFQKDPICLIILYDILFYFIDVYIAQGQEKTTLGNNFLMEAERCYHFDHWLHVSKYSSAF